MLRWNRYEPMRYFAHRFEFVSVNRLLSVLFTRAATRDRRQMSINFTRIQYSGKKSQCPHFLPEHSKYGDPLWPNQSRPSLASSRLKSLKQ